MLELLCCALVAAQCSPPSPEQSLAFPLTAITYALLLLRRCFRRRNEPTMEVGDPHVEAAVLWLARTILEVLFAGKMEAWIRQVGLTDDTGRLKSEIERAETVVAAVKGRAAKNRPLARSLGRLKELLYDADDMVDELDYYRLQQQV